MSELTYNCNTNCCVFGCKSIRKKNPNLTFHLFPKTGDKITINDDFNQPITVDRRQLWETKLRMGQKASNSLSVCSLHFEESDYNQSGNKYSFVL